MGEQSFPLNAWYAASWDHEIKHALTARTLCGTDVVLYRRSDGQVAALEDACWHRLLPLSLGHLRDDEVVCGYHGLIFNAAGRCTYMPAQETINPSACVRAYPVIEKHRLIWLWMGDPALADPGETARLPLERRQTLDRRGRHVLQPEMRLPPRRRQPHGSHPRNLRPCRQHRRRQRHQDAVRRHP